MRRDRDREGRVKDHGQLGGAYSPSQLAYGIKPDRSLREPAHTHQLTKFTRGTRGTM